MIDYIIVGAGLAGCVLAERIAENGGRVLLIEKRKHIGGTCYDCYDDSGIFVQRYGPHIFNTQSKVIWDYVNEFADFFTYHHRVLGVIEGKKVPIPFNLDSLHKVFPLSYAERLEKKLLKKYGVNRKVEVLKLQDQEDPDLKYLAEYIYEHVFLHYTEKQWGMSPKEIGESSMARIPFYISRDDRYFQNTYQGIPKDGYTRMLEKMLANSNIHILLGTDYHDLLRLRQDTHSIEFLEQPFTGSVIVTAALDELFDYCYGKLPYRSLRFVFETYDIERYQEACVVNYPENYDFTRVTEFKHMTGQEHSKTTIVKEFPCEYDLKKCLEPYYPIPHRENQKLYDRYLEQAKKFPKLILSGRLANYKYYTMAETIDHSLRIFNDKIKTFM